MNRTVGFTASIAAMMVATGEITGRGVLSAVRDIPPRAFLDRLAARGVVIDEREEEGGSHGI
jgi:lysine 6-dehydrogenase